jgi:hypothetical protein
MTIPKIIGFTLEVTDENAYREVLKTEHNQRFMCTYVEFGASPIRDRNSMHRFIKEMADLGLTYMVYPIIRTSKTSESWLKLFLKANNSPENPPKMNTFTFTIGADIRTYNDIKIEASTYEEALAMITKDVVATQIGWEATNLSILDHDEIEL